MFQIVRIVLNFTLTSRSWYHIIFSKGSFIQPDHDGKFIVTGGRDYYQGLTRINPIKGKIAIPPQYDDANSYFNGFAAVKKGDKWGILGPTGKLIIPFRFKYSMDFSEGLAAVRKGGAWFFIDKSGNKLAVPYKFSYAGNFSEGLALVVVQEKAGYIDRTDHLVLEKILKAHACILTNDLARREGEKIGT